MKTFKSTDVLRCNCTHDWNTDYKSETILKGRGIKLCMEKPKCPKCRLYFWKIPSE